MSSRDILVELSACDPAVEWIGTRTPYQAWRQCKRGDWLLWIAAELEVDRKLVVLAACDCAETALRYVPNGEDRPRVAIETARAWCDGRATIKQVQAAADAADAAATDAAYAAAYAAADAATAAYDAAAAYAASDAGIISRAHSAKLVRKRIPWRAVRDALAEIDRHARDMPRVRTRV